MSRILGHKAIAGTIAVSGIYDRFDRLPEIKAALAAWASYVENLVSGEEMRAEGRGVRPGVGLPAGSAVRPQYRGGVGRSDKRPAYDLSKAVEGKYHARVNRTLEGRRARPAR